MLPRSARAGAVLVREGGGWGCRCSGAGWLGVVVMGMGWLLPRTSSPGWPHCGWPGEPEGSEESDVSPQDAEENDSAEKGVAGRCFEEGRLAALRSL